MPHSTAKIKPERGSSKELAIRCAAAGLGAVCGGPVGAAIGGWLGAAFGPSMAVLMERYADKFMEKAGEVLFEQTAESFLSGLEKPSHLEGVYREALRRSLIAIRAELAPEDESWFEHWDLCLKQDGVLDLGPVQPSQLVPQELDRLFRSTMEGLDAMGAAMVQKKTSLRLPTRTLPDSLLNEITQRLPSRLQRNFRETLIEPQYDAAWKESVLLGQEATQRGIAGVFGRVETSEKRVLAALEERKLIPESAPAEEHKPWTLKHFVAGTSSKSAADTKLVAGQWVVATFQLKPSGGWKDPYAELQGLWNEQNNTVVPFLARPLKGILRNQREVSVEPTGLCIPSYKVDVEWREETLVMGPLWGQVKRKVVGEFLEHCNGKQMICRILHIGREMRGVARDQEAWVCRLYSADYDSFLIDRWSYYKTLEGVLSTNDLYKAGLSKANLDAVLATKMIQKEIFEASMAERFRKEMTGREFDMEDVRLVLEGLIARYETFKKNQKLRSSGTRK